MPGRGCPSRVGVPMACGGAKAAKRPQRPCAPSPGIPFFFAGTARRSGASNRRGHRTRINTGCAHRFFGVICVIGVIRVQNLALSGQHGSPAGLASRPAAARPEGQVGQREGQPHAPGPWATSPARAKKGRTPGRGRTGEGGCGGVVREHPTPFRSRISPSIRAFCRNTSP
jgi:hypothetical protein